jgi:hypothetical protein
MTQQEVTPVTPLFQTPAKLGNFLRIIIGAVVLLMLVMGIVELDQTPGEAYVLFGAGAALALLFWLILPHRFEIYADRLRVVLGGPFAFNVRLAEITAVEVLPPARAFVTSGLKFATDAGTALRISRRDKLDISLSPRDRDEFIRVLQEAIGKAS